jgi:hypothetical protein
VGTAHSSGAVGKYFNFNKAAAEEALGGSIYDSTGKEGKWFVRQLRQGEKIWEGKVVLRSNSDEGDGIGHGRRDTGAADGQFEPGDEIEFRYVIFEKGLVCEEQFRLEADCGFCGPEWGDEVKCAELCNGDPECKFFTSYETDGCRIFRRCGNGETGVAATTYRLTGVEPGEAHPPPQPKTIIPGGAGFVEVGPWRFGNVDGAHFSFSHKDGQTAVIFRSDGTVHGGPRSDFGLASSPLLPGGSDVGVGDGFLQFGPWRLGQVDGTHFSLAHESGNTAMIWRDDGTEHPGPRTDFTTFGKSLTPANIFVGDDFVQMGEWRVGNVDGGHMSIFSEETGNTAVIYRSDGTIHPGPRTDFQNKNAKVPYSPAVEAPAPAAPAALEHASYEVVSGKNDCTVKAAEHTVSGNDPDVCHAKCDTEYFSVGDGGTCHCCDSLDTLDTASPGRLGYKSKELSKGRGLFVQKFAGFFDDDLAWDTFETGTAEESSTAMIEMTGIEKDTSYLFTGEFTPPAAGDYTFRLRSKGASYLVVDGHVIIDDGGDHDSAARDGQLHLDGQPVPVLIYYGTGQKDGRLRFKWKGGPQTDWTKDLAMFKKTDKPKFPEPVGVLAKKFGGYFANDLHFAAFEGAPQEEKRLTKVDLDNEGEDYSYVITAVFHPPVPGEYSFRTRSDDASYIVVDGEMLVDNGNTHGKRTREGSVALSGPAEILVVFGQNKGGAKCEFEWMGGKQDRYTRSLALFTPVEKVKMPEPSGMKALKYEGYFDNNFEFEAFSAAPVEDKRLEEVNLGNEGKDYSYIISGVFHPPQPDTYYFRTRTDDASYIVLDGKLIVDNGNLHGARTREASIHLDGPAKITVLFGQSAGGAKCEFEWRGGRQDKYTRRLGLFTPLAEPTFPDPYGMTAKKFDGYFDDDFSFPAFEAAPKEEKLLPEVKLGNEGEKYSYLITGMFHPPVLPGDYSFRTRSDDASYIIVDGKQITDDGNEHGMRTRAGTVHLTGPAHITVFFGQNKGGAGLEFEWKGMAQSKWTRRLGLFKPLDNPEFPPPSGMRAKKFDGYFDNDFEFPAFQGAPKEEKTLREVKLGKEGDKYSYLIMGMFHPPTVPGDYSFRTRSDDASYIVVNGVLAVDDGNEHGMRTRDATVHLTGPTPITLIFGQNKGGAGLEFEWRGMGQSKFTRRLGLFTPLENPTLPPPSGVRAMKFDGYFDDDFEFPAFKAAPKETKTLREVKLGKEGDDYSYMISGRFHPPTVPGTYSFRTRSDDASYVVVNGELLVDDGNPHGMRTREGTVQLTGPADITVFFGQAKGGAGLEFEWKGEGQNKWTRRLGLFTPLDHPTFPAPMGMRLKKFDGYFDNDFEFPAFKAAPTEEKTLREVDMRKDGEKYSYILVGTFHPPKAGDYAFRTRSDDASFIIVNGAMLTDDGNEHGMRTREGTVHLTGPTKITVFFGQNKGGAGLVFEWRGGRQDKWTKRLNMFTPEELPEFPPPMGMTAKKFDGYFADDFDFAAFKEAPKEERKLREVDLGKEGDKYSYLISGTFHPPEAGDYSFRTRSDDASYIIVDGAMLTDDGNEHGMRTREGTVNLKGPAKITIFFGQNKGGAGCDFEWRGGRQDKWTKRLGLFTPDALPEFPPPVGFTARKFDGYFADDFEFPAFKGAPKEEKTLREVKLGDEGDGYSYILMGRFNPPTVPATYSFRVRSDDASYILVNGELLVDDGNHHGMRTREGSVELTGPADITIFFGEDGGGAGLVFEWKGGRQDKWTTRLGTFSPTKTPVLPRPMGMRAKKYSGYFNDDFEFAAFKAAPKEEKTLREVKLGDEGSDYSYAIAGVFHPPSPGDYSFRTRSDDGSYVIVNGALVVDNGHLHGARTREGTVHLSGPAEVLILFGELGGGAMLDFEWKGGRQAGWTRRLALYSPLEKPTFPEPFGLRARKYSGYFNDDLNFGPFRGAPASEKTVREVNFGDEGTDYSYVISGVFNPPTPGKYSFKTRSDDSSIVTVDGVRIVDNGHLHGMQTRTGSVTLDAPAEIKIYFGERDGGAGLKFKWKGGSQKSYTDRLGLFTPRSKCDVGGTWQASNGVSVVMVTDAANPCAGGDSGNHWTYAVAITPASTTVRLSDGTLGTVAGSWPRRTITWSNGFIYTEQPS